MGFRGSSAVKDLPASVGEVVRSPGREDLLEKGMAIHSSIPVWEILWTEEPDGLQLWARKASDVTQWRSCSSNSSKLMQSTIALDGAYLFSINPYCVLSHHGWPLSC